MNTCENCKHAVAFGGDYDPSFGGGCTLVNVEECHNPNVATEDMDVAIELGEKGICKYFEE
ncbi:hypothetical protein SELR_pSRC400980 (plasmid) [Selenomonas ruminantium subsp. lactilytica TAM6421]|uniref:Uncharacterized protein n=1 Tax=Selenomonas ruminantium subsp. lactilytica (strain NBRC 103574 / TAM6421) TaxID=927704 RepID=I0GVG2_SELRL|nr:hypothetical protein [Selenomonas ruminantium]BAL84749.1 hypothetical protein SELR_pSRC400980 [Selenomonas ruminantium subsp. lactilytica TAM6421]